MRTVFARSWGDPISARCTALSRFCCQALLFPSGPGPSFSVRPEKEGPFMSSNDKAASARDAALQGALTQIEREFGKGTVMRMGDEGAHVRVDAIPTGALSLDLAL